MIYKNSMFTIFYVAQFVEWIVSTRRHVIWCNTAFNYHIQCVISKGDEKSVLRISSAPDKLSNILDHSRRRDITVGILMQALSFLFHFN